MNKIFLFIFFLATAPYSYAQELPLPTVIELSLKNNFSIQSASYELQGRKQLKKTSLDLPKTDITLLYGQYNSYVKNDNNITISQSIPFSALGSQGAVNRALVASSELKKSVTENEVIYQVKQLYYQISYAITRQKLLIRQDSIYDGFLKSASLRYETGETNLLEKTTAEAQRSESKNQLRQNESEIAKLKSQLKILINDRTVSDFTPTEIKMLPFENIGDTAAYRSNPSLTYMRQQVEVANAEKKLQSSKLAPDFIVGVFTQTLIGGPTREGGPLATSSDRFTGFQVGISLPLWFAPHQARIKSAEFNKKASQSNLDYHQASLQGQLQQAFQQTSTNKSSLDYYTSSGIPNADRILKQSQIAFREGEIGYSEYLLGIRNAISIEEGYLKTLNDYNQSIIYIEYLTGNK